MEVDHTLQYDRLGTLCARGKIPATRGKELHVYTAIQCHGIGHHNLIIHGQDGGYTVGAKREKERYGPGAVKHSTRSQ